MANREWSEGRSVSGLKGFAGSSTDCSDWESDIPEDQWSEGRSVSGLKGFAGSSTDCAAWDRISPTWIVAKLRYPAGVSEEVVAEHAHSIVESMKALDPDLGLVYDPERSSEDLERRSVAVAISPTNYPPDFEERLRRLLTKGLKVEAKVPIVGLSVECDNPVAA